MISRRFGVLAGMVAAMALLLTACGGDDPTATPPPPPPPAADGFQAEWDALIAAAQAEGELQTFICCGLGRAVEQDVLPAFEKEFGIKVINSTGSSSQQVVKVKAEREAGKYDIDVWIGGLATVNEHLIPGGIVDPIKPLVFHPDVLDTSNWYRGFVPFMGVEDGAYIVALSANASLAPLGYNTNLLPDPTVIQSYKDLLKPEYKGKMVMQDPRFPGMANGLPFYLTNADLGEEFLRALITETDMTFLEARPLAEAMALDKYQICIFCGRDLTTIQREGAAVQSNWPHALKEGATIGVGGETMYAVNNAPHPNARKLFINWLLTAEGALLAQKASGADSLRIDIPNDGVDEGDIRQEGEDYYWAEVNPGHAEQIGPATALMRDIMAEAGL